MFSKRVERLRKAMKKEKIDVALFLSAEPIDDPNIYYFTGFEQMKYHSFACFLVTQKKTTLILSSLDYDRAFGKEADEIIEKKVQLSKILKEKTKKTQKIGVIESLFPYKLSKNFKKLKDMTEIVSEIRSVKEKGEIENIRKACSIANKGVDFIRKNLKEGTKEKELALELEREMIRLDSDGAPFPTVMVSSKRSAQIHPFPPLSDQKIKRGLGYVDFGVRYKGYCSDVTVPFSVGKLTEKEKKVVETVNEAYEKSLNALKNGVELNRLYETAEKFIKSRGFELRHGLGHGLGLEVHDFPSISPSAKRGEKIRKNMVFTIEPGVYVPRIGGCRLENDFIMKASGFEVLTKSRFLKI